MCGIFGIVSYDKDRVYMDDIVSKLAISSSERGIHATGLSYLKDGKVHIYKKPVAADKFDVNIPLGAKSVMGHVRFTTQGSEKNNYNNHPFYINLKDGTHGALAHNGILHNDYALRNELGLKKPKIETDTYIAVQLLEHLGQGINMDSLKMMAEKVNGSFVFTVMDNDGAIWLIKGSNPLAIMHIPQKKMFIYASTKQILIRAMLYATKTEEVLYEQFDADTLISGKGASFIEADDGDIIKLAPDGSVDYGKFDYKAYTAYYGNYSDKWDSIYGYNGYYSKGYSTVGFREEESQGEKTLVQLPVLKDYLDEDAWFLWKERMGISDYELGEIEDMLAAGELVLDEFYEMRKELRRQAEEDLEEESAYEKAVREQEQVERAVSKANDEMEQEFQAHWKLVKGNVWTRRTPEEEAQYRKEHNMPPAKEPKPAAEVTRDVEVPAGDEKPAYFRDVALYDKVGRPLDKNYTVILFDKNGIRVNAKGEPWNSEYMAIKKLMELQSAERETKVTHDTLHATVCETKKKKKHKQRRHDIKNTMVNQYRLMNGTILHSGRPIEDLEDLRINPKSGDYVYSKEAQQVIRQEISQRRRSSTPSTTKTGQSSDLTKLASVLREEIKEVKEA